MKLTKTQRETVRLMYGGHCAYCGNLLSDKWHADHVKAVRRDGMWVHDAKTRRTVYKSLGTMSRPEHDHIDNFKPACVPCNIHKADLSLERWRVYLEQSTERMRRNHGPYRHALRFGLVVEAPPKLLFYFEKVELGQSIQAQTQLRVRRPFPS